MLQILLLLTYYHTTFYDYSGIYLKKIPELEYGFKKDAYYSIKINNPGNEMILGLATRDEMKSLERVQYDSKYCDGSYRLSAIQKHILNISTELYGYTTSKGILTPYFFTCSYELTADINLYYTNGDNNLDYRFQNLYIFIVIITLITFIYIIVFIFFSCCCTNKFPKNTLNFLLTSLLFTILLQDVDAFLLFQLNDQEEYLRDVLINDDDIIVNMYCIISFCAYVVGFIFALCYSFFGYLNATKKSKSCCTFTLLIIPVICIVAVAPLSLIDAGPVFAIPVAFLIIAVMLFTVLTPPIKTFVKLGLSFYFVGVLIACPVAYCVVDLKSDSMSINMMVVAFAAAFFACQLLAMVFLMFAFRNKNGENVNEAPLVSYDSPYTVNSDSNQNDVVYANNFYLQNNNVY